MQNNSTIQITTDNTFTYLGTAQTIKMWTSECPIHGEIPSYMITSGNGSINICWACMGDFYIANMPKVKPLS